MCTQRTIDDIDSGKLVAVSKWEHYIKLWTPFLFLLGAIVYTAIWKTNIEARVFDNSYQKERTILHLEQLDDYIPRIELDLRYGILTERTIRIEDAVIRIEDRINEMKK